MAAEHGISVALLRPLAELLGRLGEEPAAFLARLGVDDAAAPTTYIAGEAVDAALAAIAARRGDAAFGLTLARGAVTWPLGIFGTLVWTSGTVRDAILRAVRFYGMVTRRTTLALAEQGDAAMLRQHVAPGVPRGAILTELPFASLVLRARAATAGRFAARAVSFTHPAPRDPAAVAAYAEVFAAPVRFGAPSDVIELDAAHLDLRLASADPLVSAALESTVARLVDAPGASAFLDRVRRAAAPHLAGAISLAQVAGAVGTSARTLRRHLELEGTSLRAIVDDLRRERADQLLAVGTSIKEIAFALGFSEPSAFSRAYKRWTGAPPVAHAARSGGAEPAPAPAAGPGRARRRVSHRRGPRA